MGFIRHYAILVTGDNPAHVQEAHAQATYIGCGPSDITPLVVNSYSSFFIPPDGSKEEWPDSDRGNEQRANFTRWLRDALRGRLRLEWCEISYGSDDAGASVTKHTWEAEHWPPCTCLTNQLGPDYCERCSP